MLCLSYYLLELTYINQTNKYTLINIIKFIFNISVLAHK